VAVNALRVIERLGTSRALDVLLDHCSRPDEPRWQIRNRAAFGCREILAEAAVPPRQVTGVARRLNAAAREEDRQLVARRLLQAISAAATADYPDDVLAQLREIWAETIVTVVDAVARQTQATDMLGVLYAEGPAFRDAYIAPRLPRDQQKKLGTIVGPALGKALEIASTNADAVRDDRQLKALYGQVIRFCQEFLKVIDLTERGGNARPSTVFDTLWNGDWSNGDPEEFRNGANSWRDILSRPPYR
jgi:hypothetical protein